MPSYRNYGQNIDMIVKNKTSVSNPLKFLLIG